MKFLAFFLFVGLSMSSKAYAQTNVLSNPVECVKDILQDIPKFSKSVGNLLCKYLHAGDEGRLELRQKVYDALTKALKEHNCNIKKIDTVVEGVGESVGEITKDVPDIVKELLDKLHLTEPALKIVCDLTNIDVLAKCIKNILKNSVETVQNALKDLRCKPAGYGVQSAEEQMGILGCHLPALSQGAMGINGENNQEAITSALNHFLSRILNHKKIGNLLKGVKCTMEKVLNGVSGGLGVDLLR